MTEVTVRRWMLPLIAMMLAPVLAGAQTYPAKAVRLVVGFTAGGPTDLPARFIADRLGTSLGQRVVVENRPGASGQIATQDVLSKPRDGYNLLLCTHFEAINAAVQRRLAYTLADVAPISQISRYYYGVVATNEIPAKDWESFIAYARANPGKLNYGTIGRGSAQEILALEIGKLAGIRMTGVPYKGGADVMNDLIAGRVQFYASPTLGVLPQYRAGKLRLLAVTSAERLAAAPEIPTVSEKGLPFVRYGWLGICAGAGTPKTIVAKLNREIVAIVGSADYRDMIEKAGSVPVSSTPEELGKVLEETYEQTERVAKEFDLKVD
ncbi:MAG TPA: tripartite tricarboxylate transporter substrate binding protein [Burkholderiales bacterium]|nr:tripartite tricarboxylate transporter substrate binding protein [Burkholderiales bacterium]